MTILETGAISGDQEIESLLARHSQVVVPNEDEEDINRFWVVMHKGEELLYLGNERTFAVWVSEEEGIQ